MHRLDVDLSHTLARQLLRMVAHLLPDEHQQVETYGEFLTAIQACFLTRDDLLTRERKRLLLPSQN